MADRTLAPAAGRPQPDDARPNDAPSDFRPTSLVATLAHNMMTAAMKAQKAGKYGAAASKFNRAVAYLESSTSEYGSDPQIIQWTHDRLAWLRASAKIAYDMEVNPLQTVGRDGLALEGTQQRRPPRPAARSAIAVEKTSHARAAPWVGKPAGAGAASASAWGKPPPSKPSIAGIVKKRGAVWTSPLTGVPMTRGLSPSMSKLASSAFGVPLRRTRSQSVAAELNDGGELEGVRLTRSVTSELACLNSMSLASANFDLVF